MSGRPWSQQDEAYLRAHYHRIPAVEIAAHLGRTYPAVIHRAKKIDVAKSTSKPVPSDEEYFAAIAAAASDGGCRPRHLVQGHSKDGLSPLRWRAWASLKERYSYSAIARVSGYDHTSIRHGIRRLKQIEHKNKPTDKPCYNGACASNDRQSADIMVA